MNNKKTKLLLIIGVITLLLTVAGATFAYFIAQGGVTSNKDVTVTTKTTDSLIFNVGDPISLVASTDNFGETNSNVFGETFASAELKANNATNNATEHYYVYLDITKNEFVYTTTDKKAELLLNVTDKDGNEVTIAGLTRKSVVDNKGTTLSGYDITGVKDAIKIIDKDITTTSTTFEKWNVKITFVNLNSDQNDNTGKSFSSKLTIQKEELKSTLANYIIDSFTTQGSNNLYHHDGTLENGINDGSYRYSGKYEEVNNWVCFGSDAETCPQYNLYRIIGVFNEKNVDTGATEKRVKLIMNEYPGESVLGKAPDNSSPVEIKSSFTGVSKPSYDVPGYYWSGSRDNSSNNWPNSTLNIATINGTYLNSFETAWTSKIAKSEWKIGGNTWSNISDATPAVAYQYEVLNPVTDETGAKVIDAKVGLMYASDYGFASSKNNWTTKLVSYNNESNNYNNWLFRGPHEWTISRKSESSNNAFRVFGYVGDDDAGYYAFGVRPVFYLESGVKYTRGTGSASDPFRIN